MMPTFSELMAEKDKKRLAEGRFYNDFERVLHLSTRPKPMIETQKEWADHYTGLYATRPEDRRLLPLQGWCLHELETYGKLVGIVGVGYGKTLVTLLAAKVLGIPAEETVLLVRPDLVKKTIRESRYEQEYFNFDIPHIVSYGKLSSHKQYAWLEEKKPKLIIADEAQYLKNPKAARTIRFMRYMREHPETIFVPLTGTIHDKSLRESAHFFEKALGNGSPLPTEYRDLDRWCSLLDIGGRPDDYTKRMFHPIQNAMNAYTPREALQLRLEKTPGVVICGEADIPTNLKINLYNYITKYSEVTELRQNWILPDGEICLSALEHARVKKQLLSGYYLKTETPPEEWREARSLYSKHVRHILQYQRKPGLDSPFLVREALEEGWGNLDQKEALKEWKRWEDLPLEAPQPVWVSDHVCDFVEQWIPKQADAWLIWVESPWLGKRLSERFNIPYYGAGSEQPGGENAIVSIAVHGTGKNLQAYGKALVLELPVSGVIWEQLLGRLHRTGQQRTQVEYDVLCQDGPAWSKTMKRAEFAFQTTSIPQRLLFSEKYVARSFH